MLRARGRTRSQEGASTISTKEKNIMLSNRRRFLQGAASAKVAPVTLQDRSYEPLKLPRPISLAALTILDVSPANQVLCAAKAGYSHVGIRLVPATPTETQYDMIGNTPMIREVEANLKAPASRSSTSKFSASSPTLVPLNLLRNRHPPRRHSGALRRQRPRHQPPDGQLRRTLRARPSVRPQPQHRADALMQRLDRQAAG